MTVDRTFALNAAYEEIKTGNWWLPPDARTLDGGDFYAQMKAPTRVRDMASDQLRYRWTETGALDHYRHAHVFDHLAAQEARYRPTEMGMVAGTREALSIWGNYSSP